MFSSCVGWLNVTMESFSERQCRHRLLVLLWDGMGFEMDQETSGVFPVCRCVFQMSLLP